MTPEQIAALERGLTELEAIQERNSVLIQKACRRIKDAEDRLAAIASIAEDYADGAEDASREEKAWMHVLKLAAGEDG